MVKLGRINGIHFNWVGVDGGYGKEPDFLRDLVSTSKSRVKCIFGLSKSSALAGFRFQKGVSYP